MRAQQPDREGRVERDGVSVSYEVFGDANAPTVFLLPSFSLAYSRQWKAQVPALARRYRVVTFDGRGNGRSDRPTDAAAYTPEEFVGDCLAVLDATATARAVFVGSSYGALLALLLASGHPERVSGAAFLAPSIPFTAPTMPSKVPRLDGSNWLGYVEAVAVAVLPEPHSTKAREDAVGWALETGPDAIVPALEAYRAALQELAGDPIRALCAAVRCPTLVIHGDNDHSVPHAWCSALAELTGGDLVTIVGGGHGTSGRHPVVVNRLLTEFVDRAVPPPPRQRTWTRALQRPVRALYVSSPIGLGHAQRDVAVADELRKLRPDLEIDWLAQHPLTAVLAAQGERIHPASRFLASESAHIESESHEHDLHAFQAFRKMDEILVANFGVFAELLAEEHYDLVIGDEAWDLDFFLHENPELKRTSFVWMTDFVGFLPMQEGGEHEAAVAADHNAEMIEQVERFRRVRDRSIFVGDVEDVVPGDFGPGLPAIRSWTEEHFAFAGYVTGFDPAALGDTEALRAELGYRPDERVCVVTVGGSGVGTALLHKVIAAYPLAASLVPGLRMVVVAGPRIDPASLPAPRGVEVRGFVPELYRHLAACDVAVVQGGLTTTMELTATGRPFLYFPLARHFEQQHHVRHRLGRYGAGRCMDYATSSPELIATELAAALTTPATYRPVASDGAARAASLIAELL